MLFRSSSQSSLDVGGKEHGGWWWSIWKATLSPSVKGNKFLDTGHCYTNSTWKGRYWGVGPKNSYLTIYGKSLKENIFNKKMTEEIESVVHWFPLQFGLIVNCQHLEIFAFECWPKNHNSNRSIMLWRWKYRTAQRATTLTFPSYAPTVRGDTDFSAIYSNLKNKSNGQWHKLIVNQWTHFCKSFSVVFQGFLSEDDPSIRHQNSFNSLARSFVLLWIKSYQQ